MADIVDYSVESAFGAIAAEGVAEIITGYEKIVRAFNKAAQVANDGGQFDATRIENNADMGVSAGSGQAFYTNLDTIKQAVEAGAVQYAVMAMDKGA